MSQQSFLRKDKIKQTKDYKILNVNKCYVTVEDNSLLAVVILRFHMFIIKERGTKMDIEKKCTELSQVRNKDDKPVFSKKTLPRLKKLPTQSFWSFIEYYEKVFVSENRIDSFNTYMSQILPFLEYLMSIDCSLENVTQETMDEYLTKFKGQKGITHKIDDIKDFLEKINLLDGIDISHHYPTISSATDEEKDDMPIITAEKLSCAKEVYLKVIKSHESDGTTDNEEYLNAVKRLFILEMFFNTPLRKEYVKAFQKGDGEFTNNTIHFKDKEYYISNEQLSNLILKVRNMDTFDIEVNVDHMEKELADYDMGILHPRGAKKTRDAIFWTCPQCGKKYLAIAENWCVKQYTENGENWIVCREICGHE